MSLNKTVKASAKKMSETARSMELEPVMDKDGKHGGFMMTHHMHDYEHPKNGVKTHLKNHKEVAKHLASCPMCGGETSKEDEVPDEDV